MDLTDIKSPIKRDEVLRVLNNPQPRHNERIWLSGFLGYIAGDPEEVFGLIDRLNHWKDYNARITKQQIQSVFKSSRKL